jgi:hypothetical protein
MGINFDLVDEDGDVVEPGGILRGNDKLIGD